VCGARFGDMPGDMPGDVSEDVSEDLSSTKGVKYISCSLFCTIAVSFFFADKLVRSNWGWGKLNLDVSIQFSFIKVKVYEK
tara:strand:- start:19975 stop:20217 length:243 start_codon:yes stop_codon:yes gene_type:complete